jgi:hypothetical protein
VKGFLDGLSPEDRAEVAAAMADVRKEGLRVARHLRGDIYEVRAQGPYVFVRLLFAQEGERVVCCRLSRGSRRKPGRLQTDSFRSRRRDWRTGDRGTKGYLIDEIPSLR